MRFLIIGVSIIFCSLISIARDSFKIYKQIPIQAQQMQVNELGDIYVLKNDNSIVKYNENGDSITNYSTLSRGRVSYIDASNPLRVLVFYKQFSLLQFLDKSLTLLSEVRLQNKQITQGNIVATASDGGIWVYDNFNTTLNKLDVNLNITVRGSELRQQLDEALNPIYMIEHNKQVFIVDTSIGILIFDQFGTYLNTLSLKTSKTVQLIGSQIIYLKDNSLYSYDLQTFSMQHIDLPINQNNVIINAIYYHSRIILLTDTDMIIYSLDK